MNAFSAVVWVVCALILAVGLALCGGRYEFHYTGGGVVVLDRWTGEARFSLAANWTEVSN